MKFSDLLRMSGSNLLRRKLRTALTVLGVVIGTASIVVMISLGLGLQKSSLEQIEQYGGLTTINVNTWGNYNSDSSQEELRIDDGVVETISKIPHVEFASPILSTYVLLKQGVYEGSLTVQGMTQEALQNMDMKVGEGTLPEADAPLSFFYGNQVITNFYNSKTNEGYWENSEAIDVDLMNQPVFVIFDTDAYYQSKNGGSGGDRSTPTTPPKKYIIPTCGMLAGGTDEYSENSYSVYADIDALKAELKKIFKNKVIPGQPTTKADPVTESLSFFHIMSGQKNRQILLVQLFQKIPHLPAGQGIHAGCRLIQKQNLRFCQQSTADHELSFHAAGQLSDRTSPIINETAEIQQFFRTLPDLLDRHIIKSSLIFHNLIHGHILPHGILLGDDTEFSL